MMYQANILNTLLKPALAGVCLVGLAACQHTTMPQTVEAETTLRNTVQMVRLPFEIQAEEDGTVTPSGATYASVSAFLASVKASYSDILMLDVGETAPERVAAIEDFIRSRGLAYGGSAKLGPAPRDGTVMLYLERYVVTTPQCGGWPDEPDNNTRNNITSGLGCTNVTSLGLMVANPRDLIAGQNGGNSTSAAVGALYTPSPMPAASPAGNMTISLDGMTMTAPMPTAPTGTGNQ